MADNGSSDTDITESFSFVLGFGHLGSYGCITNKGEFDGIVIISWGKFQVSETNNWKDNNYYNIRLVQDIEQ